MPALILDPSRFLSTSYLMIPPEERARHITLLLVSARLGELGILRGAREWTHADWLERCGLDRLNLAPLVMVNLAAWKESDLILDASGAFLDLVGGM